MKIGGKAVAPAVREPPQFGLRSAHMISSLRSFLHTLDIFSHETRWKIFELDGCEGTGKACLVFPPKSEGAQVVNLTKLT